jgi:hypothetical protein
MWYMRPAALLNRIHMSHGKDVTLKTHHAVCSQDGIPLIPARMTRGALYIIRDPRDVAISFAKHLGESIDFTIDLMGNANASLQTDASMEKTRTFHYLNTWSYHVRSWTRDTGFNTGVVKYEDLVTDTENVFRQILPCLGFHEIDEQALQFAIEQTSFSNLRRQEDESGFIERGKQERFFDKGQVGRWRDVLTDEQVRKIEEAHHEVMEEFGYEFSLQGVS